MTQTGRSPLPLLTVLALALAGPPAAGAAQDDVFVVNFPEVQEISGRVSVEAPLPHTRLVRLSETVVAPVAADDTTNLVPGGVLITEGFGSVVLSLAGEILTERFRPGSVGAVLVPDEDPVMTALEEAGQILFPLRAEAAASPAEGEYFQSDPGALTVAFPRYRIYYFNTTDSSARVRLFAYLAN